MLIVALLLIGGILAGFLIRKKAALTALADRLAGVSILILLFLLGLSLGRDDAVLRNLSLYGIQAVVLTVGALAGSVLLSLIVYRVFFREKPHGG
jgi:uncharacterized membrane protein YbjE (DUF340 family)